jgi:heme A synthase
VSTGERFLALLTSLVLSATSCAEWTTKPFSRCVAKFFEVNAKVSFFSSPNVSPLGLISALFLFFTGLLGWRASASYGRCRPAGWIFRTVNQSELYDRSFSLQSEKAHVPTFLPTWHALS